MIRPPATATDRARGRAGSMVSTAPLTSSRSAIGAGWLPTGGRIPGARAQVEHRAGEFAEPLLGYPLGVGPGQVGGGSQNLGTLNDASRSAQ